MTNNHTSILIDILFAFWDLINICKIWESWTSSWDNKNPVLFLDNCLQLKDKYSWKGRILEGGLNSNWSIYFKVGTGDKIGYVSIKLETCITIKSNKTIRHWFSLKEILRMQWLKMYSGQLRDHLLKFQTYLTYTLPLYRKIDKIINKHTNPFYVHLLMRSLNAFIFSKCNWEKFKFF